VSPKPLDSTPSQPSKKPYWTSGKIVALILVAVLVVGVSGFAGFRYVSNRPNASSNVSNNCNNGATNYPGCDVCPDGQTRVEGQCYNSCTNGATNPPTCSNNLCNNGATNPPACNNNICSNGATNFPQCTSTSCSDPANISDHIYNPYRLDVIKSCITASGVVDNVLEEADGDYHVRLILDPQYSNLTNNANDQYQYGDLIVEIICALPITQQDAVSACQGYTNNITIPSIDQHITVTGPYVLDTEHYNWAEIHPVYTLTIS